MKIRKTAVRWGLDYPSHQSPKTLSFFFFALFYYVGNIVFDISGMLAKSATENKSAKPTLFMEAMSK